MTRGRRRSYGTIRDATAYGGKNSTGDRPNFTRPAGVIAWHDGVCPKCDREVHEAQIVNRKGEWICTTCAPGADDE